MQFNSQKGRPIGEGLRGLITYREKYAKPPEQWSPMEKALDEAIKKRQKGEETEMVDDPSLIAAVYRSSKNL